MSNYMVTLAHAVGDENGKSVGGKPGDQNGKEVRLQNYYISGGKKWDYVLRCKNDALRRMIAEDAVNGARNAHLGYDQNQRYTAWNAVKDRGFNLALLDKDTECDCSQLASICCNYAGIAIPKDTYTGNMLSRYTATGCFKILSANKYTTCIDNLEVGDILLREGHHTAIVVNTVYWLKTGIYKEKATVDRKADVKAVQARLNAIYKDKKDYVPLVVDGSWGSKTDSAVRMFQRLNNLDVDGNIGSKTAKALGFIFGV